MKLTFKKTKFTILVSLIFLIFLVSCNHNSEINDPIMTIVPTSTFKVTTTNTKMPTPTFTPTTTRTPLPTSTIKPTATTIPGKFSAPLSLGESISLEAVPEEFRNSKTKNGVEEVKAELLDIKVGEEARILANQKLKSWANQELIPGQEYLAILVKVTVLWCRDNNEVVTIYPYWHFRLRYKDGGDDIDPVNLVEKFAEGYPPLEGEGWVFFLIKSGTKPYLYFQPNYLIYEKFDITNFGAYFKLMK
ncbi:MAG: hypothetical protein CVU46_11660 [Chloroflexi bacterium HGW-Chloroflexi-8]|jgi:hypothetical protein|nr:MAG: hypothetical protein CVU46_11660 [Chloroflexi bacterium HGW-Chloroflexi-8]